VEIRRTGGGPNGRGDSSATYTRTKTAIGPTADPYKQDDTGLFVCPSINPDQLHLLGTQASYNMNPGIYQTDEWQGLRSKATGIHGSSSKPDYARRLQCGIG